MSGRRVRGRLRGIPAPAVAAVALALTLAGCAPAPSPDPALVSLTSEALSATRSAELGTGLRDDGRMFTTTAYALLGDMEQKVADVARQAGLHEPADATDAAYRSELLNAANDSLDAMHAASAGRAGAEAQLKDAADRLQALEDEGSGS